MKIKNVTDPEFRRYGRIVDGYDFTEMIKVMEQTPLPEEVIYVPSDNKLEKTEPAIDLKMRIFGELPIQIGYCNGHNSKLNALEYHRSSEVNVAVTDIILLLGSEQDIASDFTYETSKVEAFLVPAGTGIEIYGTTLHYAPCGVDGNGFKAIYGQLMNVTVAEGDTITTAQNIGEVAPPSSYYTEEGTHVFFELMKNGVPINPMILMQ